MTDGAKQNWLLADLVKVGKAIKGGVELAAEDAAKVGNWLMQNKTLIEGVTATISPAAAVIEENAINLYDRIAASVESAGAAAGANGLNVTLDAQTVAAIQADIAAAKKFKV
jgi:hypothetical protein